MDEMVYYMTLTLFLKKNNRDPKDMENNKDLFPIDWDRIESYHQRTDILSEAMEKKIPIEKTDRYNDYIKKESTK